MRRVRSEAEALPFAHDRPAGNGELAVVGRARGEVLDGVDVSAAEPFSAAVPLPPEAHGTARERTFDRVQHRRRQYAAACGRRRETIEQCVLLPHEIGEVGERAGEARIQLAHERGQEPVSDAGALEVEIEVAVVPAPPDAVLDQERAHLHAVAIEKRSDDSAAPRPDAREATAPCPADDAQQDRLGLVVAGVAGCDLRCAQRVGRALEKGVAHTAGFRFEVGGRDARRLAQARHVVATGEVLDEGAIGRTLRAAHAMVEMRRDDGDVERLAQGEQSRQQGDRVGAARDGREHGVAGCEELVPSYARAHRVEKRPCHAVVKSRLGVLAQAARAARAR